MVYVYALNLWIISLCINVDLYLYGLSLQWFISICSIIG